MQLSVCTLMLQDVLHVFRSRWQKAVKRKTIISDRFKQEIEENTSTDFSLSNTKSNRCFCCCNWHKREKQFDLSLKSAYLNLIFDLSLLVVKSEFGMQLRDYKKKLKKNPKQHSGKSKTSWLLWNMFSGYHFKCTAFIKMSCCSFVRSKV